MSLTVAERVLVLLLIKDVPADPRKRPLCPRPVWFDVSRMKEHRASSTGASVISRPLRPLPAAASPPVEVGSVSNSVHEKVATHLSERIPVFW